MPNLMGPTAWFSYFLLLNIMLAPSHDAAEAEDQQNPPETYIEELTVLGERDKETLRDESHSVAVFSSEDLRLGTQRSFTELFEKIPNTSTNERGEPVIRGVPQFGIDNGLRGSMSTSTLYRDGLGMLAQPVLWDAVTAEISRGPQNELRPSIGGILAIGTTDPDYVSSGRVRMAWAPTGNDREFGFALGGPISKNWAGRVSAYVRTDDGHTKNLTQGDKSWDSYQETLGRIKLLWQPDFSPGTTVKLLGEFIGRDRGGSAEVRGSADDPSFDPFDRYAYPDADVGQRQKTPAVAIDITHDFGNPWLLNFAAGWIDNSDDTESDGDGTAQAVSVIQTFSDVEAFGMVFITYYRGEDWLIRFRQRLTHLNSNFRQNNISPFDFDGPGPLPGIRTNTRVEVPWPDFYGWTTQLSLARNFGRLRFAGSLVYEGDTTGDDFTIRSSVYEETGIPQLDAAYGMAVNDFFPQVVGQTDTKSSDLLPMISLSWSAGEQTVFGIKWEQARRAGGVTVNLARSTLDTYKPENADNFDLFARANRFDGRLSIAANAFYTRSTDLQVNAALTTTPLDNQVVNARKANSAGLELEVAWTDANWSAFATAALLRSELDDIKVGITDFSGKDYPFAPQWSLSVGGSYDAGAGVFAAFDFSLRDSAPGSFDNRAGNVAESRTLLNMRAGWRWKTTSLSIYARNLLDDKYHGLRDLNLPTGQNQFFHPGDPREVGITLEMDW